MYFSDGIGKIIFVTPSNGCKIRLTRKSTGSQMKAKRAEMLSYGIHRYPFFEWNPMGSMGTQRSPSMSIEITSLVVNLTSDKCSLNEICLFLKAMKRNSSFQARMT